MKKMILLAVCAVFSLTMFADDYEYKREGERCSVTKSDGSKEYGNLQHYNYDSNRGNSNSNNTQYGGEVHAGNKYVGGSGNASQSKGSSNSQGSQTKASGYECVTSTTTYKGGWQSEER
ncbi:MAG: hypothetical protein IKM10_03555 [Bacteroidaceae bacterium]|nr:hypothetical protein [Bacteroidaceae bacterium]